MNVIYYLNDNGVADEEDSVNAEVYRTLCYSAVHCFLRSCSTECVRVGHSPRANSDRNTIAQRYMDGDATADRDADTNAHADTHQHADEHAEADCDSAAHAHRNRDGKPHRRSQSNSKRGTSLRKPGNQGIKRDIRGLRSSRSRSGLGL